MSYGQDLKTAVEGMNLVQADGMISNDEGKYTFTATLADGDYYVDNYPAAVIPGKVNYNNQIIRWKLQEHQLEITISFLKIQERRSWRLHGKKSATLI